MILINPLFHIEPFWKENIMQGTESRLNPKQQTSIKKLQLILDVLKENRLLNRANYHTPATSSSSANTSPHESLHARKRPKTISSPKNLATIQVPGSLLKLAFGVFDWEDESIFAQFSLYAAQDPQYPPLYVMFNVSEEQWFAGLQEKGKSNEKRAVMVSVAQGIHMPVDDTPVSERIALTYVRNMVLHMKQLIQVC